MPVGGLTAWLDGDRRRLVWIEFDDYAHRVFAGAAADWLIDANVFVAAVSQAHSVVATEILSIDILPAYLAHLERNSEQPGNAVQAMLQLEAPRSFLSEVIDALAHRFADHIDLVLKVPSPAVLLRHAGVTAEPSFDDLDDIGIALSEVLRDFSTRPFAGVLISSSESVSADEAEALEPVVGAARHYAWRVGLSLDGARAVPDEMPQVDLDVLLLPGVGIAELSIASAASYALGGGLGGGYWHDDGPAPNPSGRYLLYGTIPPDTQPELVVRQVTAALA